MASSAPPMSSKSAASLATPRDTRGKRDFLALEPSRCAPAAPPVVDLVEGPLEAARQSKATRGLPGDLAAGRLVALAKALAARKDERRRPDARQRAHSASGVGDERPEDIAPVRDVRLRHRTVDRELSPIAAAAS
jgi:hypothetical protein